MLGVADFTKFVNLTSGNLFKNRDLIIILRRIGNDVVSLQEMYKIICKDYKWLLYSNLILFTYF